MMKRRRRLIRSRVLLAAVLLGLAALAGTGCHTVRGIGQDISALADGGQEIIDKGVD